MESLKKKNYKVGLYVCSFQVFICWFYWYIYWIFYDLPAV